VTSRELYSELHRIARRRGQRGYFTSKQAQGAGVSRTKLSRLVAGGLVDRAAPGVYRFGVGHVADWKDRLAVELLKTGGAAGGLSASALSDLADPPGRPSVLIPRGQKPDGPGRHTTRDIAKHELITVDGLRTLNATRAVIDSAHLLPRAKAIAMVERAIVRGLVNPAVLRDRATELKHHKRPGCAVVLSILDELNPEVARSRNEWEALVARRAQQCGLEPPALEFEIFINGHRYIADAAWPGQRVALEFDGRDPHMRKTVHDYDTLRRNDFTDAGWLRFGITASALKRRDNRAFEQVARAIASR
jgi:hypothetical protein